MEIRIGVVGYGYWGPNLVRNFNANPRARVVAISDARESARASAVSNYPTVEVGDDFDWLIKRDGVDAIVIATPVATHYEIARKALDHGKHVLVEKPICGTANEAIDLIARAKRADRTLMVDHTFLFTGAVRAVSDMIKKNTLGKLCYFDSSRVNLGLFQPDVNCLWDLAPHDLSILGHLVQDQVLAVEASGFCHVNTSQPDMVYLTIHYAHDMVAHLNLSWMSPVKVRRFTIGGTEKMLVWDDLDQEQPVRVYDRSIAFQKEDERSLIIPEYRLGDIYSPRVPIREALQGVAEHFISVIHGETSSIMSGDHGLRVVQLLELAQQKLDRSLESIRQLRISAGL